VTYEEGSNTLQCVSLIVFTASLKAYFSSNVDLLRKELDKILANEDGLDCV